MEFDHFEDLAGDIFCMAHVCLNLLMSILFFYNKFRVVGQTDIQTRDEKQRPKNFFHGHDRPNY